MDAPKHPAFETAVNERDFVAWFRRAAPYIHAHRGRTFVVEFGGEAVAAPGFPSLVHDLALLSSLGIRLVLVHGARPQVETRLREAGRALRYEGGLRITDEEALPLVKEAVGQTRIRVEARLSMGLANSPMHGARLRVSSGNFVTARPLGVRDGVDYCFTGQVRRVDHQGMSRSLDDGAIVLLSPLGYSPTGEVFNVSAEEIAVAAAAALRADKLIILSEDAFPLEAPEGALRELNLGQAEARLGAEPALGKDAERHLRRALGACRAGVGRTHLLSRRLDGALLLELFTRDGVGTLVTGELYDDLRPANIEDVGGIIALIRPLEADGTLVRRSRELLEVEVERFTVLERDGAVIGCAALYPFCEERVGELACVAVSPEYRNRGRADALLAHIENQALRQGLDRLFVLTTRAAHWFQERGFEPAEIDRLPVARQALYNLQRRSKVFIKAL